MKKVIALSWDKLFVSCSQFESKLAGLSYRTAILSSSFAKERVNGTTNRHEHYLSKLPIADKFSAEEVCERFAYLKSLLVSGYDLVIITSLEAQSPEVIRDLLKEQGFFIPVVSVSYYMSITRLHINYDIYINYDWLKIMPAMIIAPDFYLVKSAIFLKICLSKVRKFFPLGSFAKN